AGGRGVVGCARRERAQGPFAQLVGDRELLGGEVADGEVGDLPTRHLDVADLAGDLEDLGPDQPARHAAEAAPGVRAVQVEVEFFHRCRTSRAAAIYHKFAVEFA